MKLYAHLFVCMLSMQSCICFAQDSNAVAQPAPCPGSDAECAQPVILKNPDLIEAGTLCGVDLVEFTQGGHSFTPEEVRLLTEFIRNGGSLFSIIDEENRTPLLNDGIQLVLSEFGLSYSANVEYLHNCGAVAKAGVINASDRELPFSGGREILGGTPFAWRLDREGNLAGPFAAYVETQGGGRIVALSEGMVYLNLGSTDGVRLSGPVHDYMHTTYWGKDSALFLQEVRAWLLN